MFTQTLGCNVQYDAYSSKLANALILSTDSEELPSPAFWNLSRQYRDNTYPPGHVYFHTEGTLAVL